MRGKPRPVTRHRPIVKATAVVITLALLQLASASGAQAKSEAGQDLAQAVSSSQQGPDGSLLTGDPGGSDKVATVGLPSIVSSSSPTGVFGEANAVGVRKPLAGLVIALDPGHQLGNSNPRFAKFIHVKRWQGRIWKICNTTGTATNSGYPEATFNWQVALILRAKLQALGAVVPMTRTVNSWNAWGPCTWTRGKFGMKVHAKLMIQIHADGAPSSGHGFHIITPGLTRGWTDHIWRADLNLAKAMRKGMIAAGVIPSTYISGAINIRTDQSAMNISQIPTVTVENGNMRNQHDAALMKTKKGQLFFAQAMLRGILAYLGR